MVSMCHLKACLLYALWLQGPMASMCHTYPIAIIVADSQLAQSLLPPALKLKIGDNAVFPDRLRQFSRKLHGSIIRDDVRDLRFLTDHQHLLQSAYDDEALTFATSPGGTCEYTKDVYREPFVVTASPSTKNLEELQDHAGPSKAETCVVLKLSGPAFVDGPAALSR